MGTWEQSLYLIELKGLYLFPLLLCPVPSDFAWERWVYTVLAMWCALGGCSVSQGSESGGLRISELWFVVVMLPGLLAFLGNHFIVGLGIMVVSLPALIAPWWAVAPYLLALCYFGALAESEGFER